MKYKILITAMAVGLAFSAAASGQPVAGSANPYVPRLGDIMGATQLRHIKLWFAGKEKNWALAEYELEQIRYTFQDALTLYPGLPAANMTTMTAPTGEIDAAIKAKDSSKFAKAFGHLTTACNSCHRAQGYGYISITVPGVSPFSDERFSPK